MLAGVSRGLTGSSSGGTMVDKRVPSGIPETGRLLVVIASVASIVGCGTTVPGTISVSDLSNDPGASTGEDARPAFALVGSSTGVTTPNPVGISNSFSGWSTLSKVMVEGFGEGLLTSRFPLPNLNG